MIIICFLTEWGFHIVICPLSFLPLFCFLLLFFVSLIAFFRIEDRYFKRIMKIPSLTLKGSRCFLTRQIWFSCIEYQNLHHMSVLLASSPDLPLAVNWTSVLLFQKIWSLCRYLARSFTFYSCVYPCTLTWRMKWLKAILLLNGCC